jgi:hypothetical protein
MRLDQTVSRVTMLCRQSQTLPNIAAATAIMLTASRDSSTCHFRQAQIFSERTRLKVVVRLASTARAYPKHSRVLPVPPKPRSSERGYFFHAASAATSGCARRAGSMNETDSTRCIMTCSSEPLFLAVQWCRAQRRSPSRARDLHAGLLAKITHVPIIGIEIDLLEHTTLTRVHMASAHHACIVQRDV